MNRPPRQSRRGGLFVMSCRYVAGDGAEIMFAPGDPNYANKPTPANYSVTRWINPVRPANNPDGGPKWMSAQRSPVPPIWYGSVVAPVMRHGALIGATGLELGQLVQAQKLEAVGRLAGGVAHDFNNLLTAVMSYGELLKASFGVADDRRSDVDEILNAGHRGAQLTKQLLGFARRQAPCHVW